MKSKILEMAKLNTEKMVVSRGGERSSSVLTVQVFCGLFCFSEINVQKCSCSVEWYLYA